MCRFLIKKLQPILAFTFPIYAILVIALELDFCWRCVPVFIIPIIVVVAIELLLGILWGAIQLFSFVTKKIQRNE
jgi:hypothetical protein